MTQQQALFLGFGRSIIASRLIAELRSEGIGACQVACEGDLPSAPAPRSRPLVFIDCRTDEKGALHLLHAAQQRYGTIVGIAVVKQSDFCQYYRLMEAGATGYFLAKDQPAFIARSARLLAQV